MKTTTNNENTQVQSTENIGENTNIGQSGKSGRRPGRPVDITKINLKRVVLLDGQPVGKGRPEKDSKRQRTVVYVPVNESYDRAKFGVGKPYNPSKNSGQRHPFRRMKVEQYIQLQKQNNTGSTNVTLVKEPIESFAVGVNAEA